MVYSFFLLDYTDFFMGRLGKAGCGGGGVWSLRLLPSFYSAVTMEPWNTVESWNSFFGVVSSAVDAIDVIDGLRSECGPSALHSNPTRRKKVGNKTRHNTS